MAGNTNPIYTRVGQFTTGANLTTAANDYNGASPYNREVFAADTTNGSFLQKIRFKAMGTNVATVARIYISDGDLNTNWTTAMAAPTGTPSATGGTMLTGSYYGMVIAIGNKGSQSVVGTYSTAVAVTGSTGSIAWTWTAVAGAVSYRIYTSTITGYSTRYFTSVTNSYTQTQMPEMGVNDDPTTQNMGLFGEVSLPATTASATAATPEIEYPMNIAIPPGFEVYVGLGTTVAAGWHVMSVGGDY